MLVINPKDIYILSESLIMADESSFYVSKELLALGLKSWIAYMLLRFIPKIVGTEIFKCQIKQLIIHYLW